MIRFNFELTLTFLSHNCTRLAKRPDQANNKRPTLGHTIQSKTNTRYRQGYHYQPIPSTSQQSPTFVLESCEFPNPNHQHHHHHEASHIDATPSPGKSSAATPNVAGPSKQAANCQRPSTPPNRRHQLPSSSSAEVMGEAVA